MLFLFITLLFVTLVDTSGLSLDEKLTRLLYVEEVDEGDEEVYTEEQVPEEIFTTEEEKALEDLFSDTSNKDVSDKEVMDAIKQIYKE